MVRLCPVTTSMTVGARRPQPHLHHHHHIHQRQTFPRQPTISAIHAHTASPLDPLSLFHQSPDISFMRVTVPGLDRIAPMVRSRPQRRRGTSIKDRGSLGKVSSAMMHANLANVVSAIFSPANPTLCWAKRESTSGGYVL